MSEEDIIEPENEELDEEEDFDEPIEEELDEEPNFNKRQPDINRANSYNRQNRNGFNSKRQKNLNNPQQGNEFTKRPTQNGGNKKTTQSGNSTNTNNKSGSNLQKGLGSLFGNGKDGEFTIKIPLKVKIICIAIFLGLALILLMLFVVLFGNEEQLGTSGIGSQYAYGQTCTQVTVTDTGCDSNGQNCSNRYDGNVELEEYVAGVVAAEVGGANNLEYYKVAAITARTYFLMNTNEDCTIEGNSSAQAYMDVNNSSYAELIKQAVEETEGLVIVKGEELAKTNYASACVVNADTDYYYVRYGTSSLGKANYQKIPKEWDADSSHAYSGYLKSWYSKVDQNSTDYENKRCPNNHDYGMSQLGALYLITGENYRYDEVLKYYYGNEVEIKKNEMQHIGAEGFINPTRYLRCTSAYGYRIHPKYNVKKFHSGIDIGISGGEPIYAAKDGTITFVRSNINKINDCNYGYGNYITIDHGDGTTTRYAHIKYGSIPDYIVVGATVSQGEQIGQVGSTGCSTGNHLHYEVRVNGSTADPADYMDLTEATGTCKR